MNNLNAQINFKYIYVYTYICPWQKTCIQIYIFFFAWTVSLLIRVLGQEVSKVTWFGGLYHTSLSENACKANFCVGFWRCGGETADLFLGTAHLWELPCFQSSAIAAVFRRGLAPVVQCLMDNLSLSLVKTGVSKPLPSPFSLLLLLSGTLYERPRKTKRTLCRFMKAAFLPSIFCIVFAFEQGESLSEGGEDAAFLLPPPPPSYQIAVRPHRRMPGSSEEHRLGVQIAGRHRGWRRETWCFDAAKAEIVCFFVRVRTCV